MIKTQFRTDLIPVAVIHPVLRSLWDYLTQAYVLIQFIPSVFVCVSTHTDMLLSEHIYILVCVCV